MNKDKYHLSLKLEKACRPNKEVKLLTLQAVYINISRFQNTQNSSGAKPLINHTFSVKSPLDHGNNVLLIALIFSEVYFTKHSQCFSFCNLIRNWCTYADEGKNVNKYPPIKLHKFLHKIPVFQEF